MLSGEKKLEKVRAKVGGDDRCEFGIYVLYMGWLDGVCRRGMALGIDVLFERGGLGK